MIARRTSLEGEAGYGADLAYAHHAGFGAVAAEAGALLLRELRRAGHDDGLVVDLGCGSGILARVLTDAGYGVVGVDLSADMLRLAARTAPAATFVQGSLLDADLPACAGVAAVGEAVNYAFDRRAGAASLRRLLRRVHRALVPGGVFVFDVAGPGRAGRGGRTEAWRAGATGPCTARRGRTLPGGCSSGTSRCSGRWAARGGGATSATSCACTTPRK